LFQRLFDLIPDTYLTQTAVSALQIKKQRLGTAAITDRGDRIRTCDLVLPKHDIISCDSLKLLLIT